MQVFKAFFKIVKYNRSYMIMSLVITLVITVMMSSSAKDDDKTEVVKDSYNLVVVDSDNSEMSKALYKYIDKNHNIKKETYSDDMITDLLYYQQISEYIVIPKGFGDEFVKTGKSTISGKYDEAVPSAIFVNNQINEFLTMMKNKIDEGNSIDSAYETSVKALDTSEFVSIEKKENSNLDIMQICFTFLPYSMMLIIFSGCLKPIITFNETERKNRTDISALKTRDRSFQLALASATLSAVFFVIVVAFVSFYGAKEMVFTKQWVWAVCNLLIYTVAISCLMFAISTFIKKDGSHTNMISNVFTLSFAFLGGSFVPLELLGDNVKAIGRFVPNFWYSTALENICKSADYKSILNCFALEIVFGVCALAVGLCSNKIRTARVS